MNRGVNAVRVCLFLLLCAFGLPSVSSAATPSSGRWIGTWAAAPEAEPEATAMLGSTGSTFREIVHTSAGGAAVRIVLTNEFGLEPLAVGAAQIGRPYGSRLASKARPALTMTFAKLRRSSPI